MEFVIWVLGVGIYMIRLLVADDSAEFRKSARTMLAFERDIEVVGVARDGQEAVELAQKLQPDIAVMDINMPRLDGLAAIRAIAKVSPATVCMIMSSEDQGDLLKQAMAAGVREYLTKPFTTDEFVAAVRRAEAQAATQKKKVDSGRLAKSDRDKYLFTLVLEYFKAGRTDADAAKVYADYAAHPEADLDLVARLAEVFLTRRDWKTLRAICERMEKFP